MGLRSLDIRFRALLAASVLAMGLLAPLPSLAREMCAWPTIVMGEGGFATTSAQTGCFEDRPDCVRVHGDQCVCSPSNDCPDPTAKPTTVQQDVDSALGTGEPFAPTLSIPIPNLQLTKIKLGAAGQYLTIPWIGEYVAGAYAFAIDFSFAIAGVMIVLGGFQMLTSGGDAGRYGKGKERVVGAIMGMGLVLAAYVILNTVSPNLTVLDPIKIATVERKTFGLPDDFSEDEDQDVTSPPGVTTGGVLPTKTTKSPVFDKNITFNTEAMPSLLAAGAALGEATKNESWGPARIAGGGVRSLNDQASMYRSRCIAGVLPTETLKNGRISCTIPTCNPYGSSALIVNPQEGMTGRWLRANARPQAINCPHTTGMAIDISCHTSTSVINGIHVPCHLKLEKAMKEQGFCRLRTEPWHFEKPKLSGNCDMDWTPGVYMETNPSNPTGPKIERRYGDCDGFYNSYSGATTDKQRCTKFKD